MEQILIDANVISKHLHNQDGILGDILEGYKLVISSIALTELLATTKANDAKTHKEIVEFVNKNFEVLPVSPEIAQAAGDLVRQLEITLGQATIAATAIVSDTPLLTYEMETFDVIPDLKLIDI